MLYIFSAHYLVQHRHKQLFYGNMHWIPTLKIILNVYYHLLYKGLIALTG